MKDDSLEELLEWDITQNKTVTAWSSQVSSKNRGRKTYSRRRVGGVVLRRQASFTSHRSFSETSDSSTALTEESSAELELGIPPPPPPPRPVKLSARANSETIHDRKQGPRMRRANSISHSRTTSSFAPPTKHMRRSSMPRQSFGLISDFAENIDPNLHVLEEIVSPKRAKVDFGGRKKARAEMSIPENAGSDSFSNLAKFGEEGLSWAKPGSAFTSTIDLGTEHPSPSHRHKKSSSSDFDFSDFIESSPAGASVGSSRKRGICESPMYDFDDCSFSATPAVRRSRFFSPGSEPPSPGFLLQTGDGDREAFKRAGASGRSGLDEFESDDGFSDADDSGDDASTESMDHATTPQNRFVSFDEKQRSQSALGFSPENQLEPGKSRAEDVIKSMPSLQDLRFLVKSLRKEKIGSRTSWHVAPPVAWDSNRRSAFFQWTTRSLGFSFRAGGMAIAYLQIAKNKGAGILELLESAMVSSKQKGLGRNTPLGTAEKPAFSFSIPKEPFTSKILSLTPRG
eukprot:scaffold22800_cov204-Cylindrotheca_fusiformis.AAC.3